MPDQAVIERIRQERAELASSVASESPSPGKLARRGRPKKRTDRSEDEIARAKTEARAMFANLRGIFDTLKDETLDEKAKLERLSTLWWESAAELAVKHAYTLVEYKEEINFGAASLALGGYYGYTKAVKPIVEATRAAQGVAAMMQAIGPVPKEGGDSDAR